MNPDKVSREGVKKLTDLPNVGPKMAQILNRAGIDRPEDLEGYEAFELYRGLCHSEGQRLDPCVLDMCLSISRFMVGEAPRVWWAFTAERKQHYPDL